MLRHLVGGTACCRRPFQPRRDVLNPMALSYMSCFMRDRNTVGVQHAERWDDPKKKNKGLRETTEKRKKMEDVEKTEKTEQKEAHEPHALSAAARNEATSRST